MDTVRRCRWQRRQLLPSMCPAGTTCTMTLLQRQSTSPSRSLCTRSVRPRNLSVKKVNAISRACSTITLQRFPVQVSPVKWPLPWCRKSQCRNCYSCYLTSVQTRCSTCQQDKIRTQKHLKNTPQIDPDRRKRLLRGVHETCTTLERPLRSSGLRHTTWNASC